MNSDRTKCIEETGKELILNNQDIVKYLCSIEDERNTLDIIIQKQYEERRKIESEIERLTYKLCLINKSLSMRIKAKNNYDRTIDEIKSHYEKLVDSSTTLKKIVEKTQQELDDIMNKRTGTGAGPDGEEVKMLYAKENQDQCPCVYMAEVPTKESASPAAASPPTSPPPTPLPPTSSSDDIHNNVNRFRSGSEPEGGTENQNRTSWGSNNSKLKTSEEEQKRSSWSSNNSKLKTSEEELEMASIAAENVSTRSYPPLEPARHISDVVLREHLASDDEVSSIIDKPGGPLPDITTTDDISTHMLISRLKKSLNKITESPNIRPRDEPKLVNPQDPSRTVESSISRSLESNSAMKQKMAKRSVSDVLKATRGLS